jgi:uncharacterized membrane protein YGL010W
MKSIQQWLAEYGESHQNETNKTIHWICVPAIFFSVVGLLHCIKLPITVFNTHLSMAFIVLAMAIVYYFLLSRTLWIGMLLFGAACIGICLWIENLNFIPLWAFCTITFVLAWIGQFYGHKIEGKKPSFLKDIQFLMMGPAWLMSFIYKKMGIGI